jgi:DNA-directed RNA polymerase specialized sigma24 family protein
MLVTRERSFAALHSENYGRIYRYIAYRISDADRAEELAGDVFRIAWEKDLPGEPGIMLAYWDGLTTAELAQSLGCSVSAAGVRLHRARKAFAGQVPAHLMNERTA